MTKVFAKVFLCAMLIAFVHGNVYFSSHIVVTEDSKVPNAVVQGTMYYFYNTTTSDAFNHMSRTDFTSPVNMIEIINYTSSIRYKYCGECFADTFTEAADQLFWKDTDTRDNSLDYDNCLGYTRATGTVKRLWVLNTDTGVLCKVKLQDAAGDSRTITFDHFNKTVPAGTFAIRYNWDCPGPICRRVMDVVLVFDESGSISNTEWVDEISFANQLMNQFDIGIETTNIGVVFFAWVARLISPLTKSKESALNAISTAKLGGYTCIGCGITVGVQHVLPNKVLGRAANPAEIMITLTDGANNRPTEQYQNYYPGFVGTPWSNLTASTALLRARSVTSIAIGVGNEVQTAELNEIASDIEGVQTVIQVSEFALLPTVIEKIVHTTCTTLGEQPCGDQCYGFCSCNQTCVCPTCAEINSCFTSNCTIRPDGTSSGCVIRAVNCDDNDACTLDWCENATGCKHTAVTCDDGNACTENLCDSDSGCYYPEKNCVGTDPCYEYYCDTTTSCQRRYLCNDDPCKIGTCTASGCEYAFGCNDADECTTDWCNSTGGNHCQHDPIDVATVCNDGKFCTDDVCIPSLGCSNVPHDCNNGLTCMDSFCNTTSDQCQDDPDTDCTGCGQAIAAGLDCSANLPLCKTGFCESVNETWGECQTEDVECTTNNKCKIPFCDDKSGLCNATDKICTHVLPCTVGKCDPATGDCYTEPLVCPNSGDPCWVDYCDELSDSCKRKAFCQPLICEVATCAVSDNGLNASCSYSKLDCSTGSVCMPGQCNMTSGQCDIVKLQCSDGIRCTKDECDRFLGCTFTNLTCDDDDPCTLDFCSEDTGCYHTPKCNDGLFCTEDVCQLDGTCVFRELACNLDLTSPGKECFVEACDEVQHCHYHVSATALLDVCGNCIITYGVNNSWWNESWIRTACVDGMTWPEYVAVLTAAALAGIIIAVIIIALIMAIGGFFGTKELIARAKAAANQTTQNNPLYQEPGGAGTNPAYTGA